MKLLFDHNLSPHLCDRLRDIYTDLVHGRPGDSGRRCCLGVRTAARLDHRVQGRRLQQPRIPAGRATEGGLDSRWQLLARDIEQLLRGQHDQIETFAANEDAALLVVE